MKRTALYSNHVALGGRMVDFGGWELPVQYTGVLDEHLACRKACGLFDVSHMGEIMVEGPGAADFLDAVLTNQIRNCAIGQAQYNLMCLESGGIVDDLVIYRLGEQKFFLVVNASNSDKDFEHLVSLVKKFKDSGWNGKKIEATVTNLSTKYSQIAIQGPKALEILQEITSTDLKPIRTYGFAEGKVMGEIPALLGRTGYTGEDGFEVYVPWDQGPKVWEELIKRGKPHGLKPCGLAARDTLRLEMKYALYGHEINETSPPLEAGLGWVVKLEKGDFVGRAAILKNKESGLKRKLVGLKMIDRGVPRQDYKILDSSGVEIGFVTSGTHSPSLNAAIAIAYVTPESSSIGSQVQVQIRDQKIRAEVVKTPFYNRPT